MLTWHPKLFRSHGLMCVKRDAGESLTLLSDSSLLITCFMHKLSQFTHLRSTHVTEASFRAGLDDFFLIIAYFFLSTSCSVKLSECCCTAVCTHYTVQHLLHRRLIERSGNFMHSRFTSEKFTTLWEAYLCTCMIRVEDTNQLRVLPPLIQWWCIFILVGVVFSRGHTHTIYRARSELNWGEWCISYAVFHTGEEKQMQSQKNPIREARRRSKHRRGSGDE